MVEVNKGLKNLRAIPCSRIRNLNIVKMSTLLNLIRIHSAMPIKTKGSYFCQYQQTVSKVNIKRQKTKNIYHNIDREEQSWKNDTK